MLNLQIYYRLSKRDQGSLRECVAAQEKRKATYLFSAAWFTEQQLEFMLEPERKPGEEEKKCTFKQRNIDA